MLSGDTSTSAGPDTPVGNELQSLLDKIASLQEDNWKLQTQVDHLENAAAAQAEDIIQKSAIIQNYFMENKAGMERDKSGEGQK